MLLASLVLVLLPLSLNGIDRQCVNFPEEECPPQDGCIILSYIKHNDSLLCCHFETPFLLQEALGEKIKEINEIKPGVNITALHIRNVSFYSLDVSALNNFPLQFVSITDNSVLRNLSGQFNQFQSGPGCLNFSTNNLDILDVNILKNIDKLQFLDLSQNNLTSLPHLPDTNDTLHLDISGNKNVLCNEVKAIMMAENKPHFERQDNTYCSSSQTFHWFNSTERIPLLEKVCPQGHDYKCKCETVRLFIVPGKPPAYSVQVDCSGQRLTALPELLPNNTVHLNISNNNSRLPTTTTTVVNPRLDRTDDPPPYYSCTSPSPSPSASGLMTCNQQSSQLKLVSSSLSLLRTAAKVMFEQRDGQSVDLAQVGGREQACESPQAPAGGLGNGKQTEMVAAHTGCYGSESFSVVSSLTPLVSNLAYKEIRVFIADNNYISSILNLEGSDFIKTFNVLSLRKNNLKTLPTYILSNTFDRNVNSKMYLGLNKLHCDCNTAQIIKMWLFTNKKYVLDVEDVLCDNFKERVIDLDKNLVCMTQRVWTDYIYYIIAGQVALLLLLVSKVSYDYWVFKTTGYLPWPASKMPKMPCDWLFES
uniref:Protein halfway n=1 Tax=Timema douglasi TaxID=61478 RepID=A0A7R8VKY0_TIMDO|nr:unnamed protein product [Timema douglasi]